MEKTENEKFLELLAKDKGISDPDALEKFKKETVLGLISA